MDGILLGIGTYVYAIVTGLFWMLLNFGFGAAMVIHIIEGERDEKYRWYTLFVPIVALAFIGFLFASGSVVFLGLLGLPLGGSAGAWMSLAGVLVGAVVGVIAALVRFRRDVRKRERGTAGSAGRAEETPG